MKIKKIKAKEILINLLFVLAVSNFSISAESYQLVETINMSGFDILNIGSDGSNLLILDNGNPDRIKVVNTSGGLINSFSTGSSFTSGITYNGNNIVFGSGPSASYTYLKEMNKLTGTTSAYLSSDLGSVMGMGFDGSNILVSYYAQGTAGVLTSNITKINASSYANVGKISVTMNTGTAISATPTYGVAWHNSNLFISLQGVDKVYRFDSGLSLVEEIPINSSWPRGIAFIGDDLFVADRGAQKIYRYTPTTTTSTSSTTTSTTSTTTTTMSGPVSVARDLPSAISPGKSFTVTLRMNVDEANKPNVVGLTEYYPAGWVVSSISESGSDKGDRIEWLFWSYGSPVADKNITYIISVPAAADGSYDFNGTIYHGSTAGIGGDASVLVMEITVNVTRDLPDSAYTGASFTVTLGMDVDESNKPSAVGITEIVPTGWNVSAISSSGVYFADQHKIEWLFANITNPVQDRNITYVATVPAGASGTAAFSGTVDFGGAAAPSINGDVEMSVLQGCALEGDTPPCGTVTLSEVVALINQWSTGQASLSEVVALINAWAGSVQ